MINLGQRDYLSKATQLFGNEIRIHQQWVGFPKVKSSRPHNILVDTGYFGLCHTFFQILDRK